MSRSNCDNPLPTPPAVRPWTGVFSSLWTQLQVIMKPLQRLLQWNLRKRSSWPYSGGGTQVSRTTRMCARQQKKGQVRIPWRLQGATQDAQSSLFRVCLLTTTYLLLYCRNSQCLGLSAFLAVTLAYFVMLWNDSKGSLHNHVWVTKLTSSILKTQKVKIQKTGPPISSVWWCSLS